MTDQMRVKLLVRRSNGWQEYNLQVHSKGYVLDALEAAHKIDPSLLFRHACHHASCGTCGLRINGRERLACITRLADVTRPGKALRLEPLRNFKVLGDLLVDFGPLMRNLDKIDLPPQRSSEQPGNAGDTAGQPEFIYPGSQTVPGINRLENCIECGLCISACPVAGTDSEYLGPAALAAAGRISKEPRGRKLTSFLALVDATHGVWRCHGAYECTQVCPAGVDPAREIMSLRRQLLLGRLAAPDPREGNE